jgi:O-antigen ligase
MFISHPSFLRSSLLGAATGAMLWMLVLTASRSGTLSVIVSVLLTSMLVLRGSSRGKLIGATLVIALVISIVAAPRVFWERMGTMASDDSSGPANADEASADMSENNRTAVLMRSIDYTLTHPVFGLGLGNLSAASGNDLRNPDAWVGAHNTFAEISSEAGVPALLLFVALLIMTASSMKRIGRSAADSNEHAELTLMARATLASLVSFIFGAFFAHLGYEYFLYTCPLAIGVGIQRVAVSAEDATSTVSDPLGAAHQTQALTTEWMA